MAKIKNLKENNILIFNDQFHGEAGCGMPEWFNIPEDWVGKRVKDVDHNCRRIIFEKQDIPSNKRNSKLLNILETSLDRFRNGYKETGERLLKKAIRQLKAEVK
jgi:hypothetical protein